MPLLAGSGILVANANQNAESQVIKVPFIGIPTQRDTGKKDQRYVNVFIEPLKNEFAGDTKFFLTKRPGLIYNSQPSGAVEDGRGIYSWRNDLYSVFGNRIYKNGTVLSPTLTTTTGRVDFTETSAIAATPYLAVNDGSATLYLINTAGAVTSVTGGNYPASNVGDLVFLDGYIFVAESNGRIWNCANEDPTSWGALSFINAQRFHDGIVGIARQNDIFIAFGEWSTEYFFNAGNPAPNSPLQRLDQGALQVGCASNDTIMQHENFVIWVSRAQTGGYAVQKLDGITNLKKISDAPLERFLNAEATSLDDAYAYSFRAAGHFFYVLTLPSADRTFVYDITYDCWVEWQSGNTGRFAYIQAHQHQDVELIQHETNGKIYQVSQTKYQDDDLPIFISIQTAPIDFDTQRRKFCSRYELIGDRQDINTYVNVSYSDDNYRTFSFPKRVDLSQRAWLAAMGNFRRRAWLLTNSTNGPLRLEAFEMEFTFGDY